MNKEQNDVGGRITLIRGSESQAAFAERIGVHKNTLGNYERNRNSPDAEFLKKMAQLGINTHWLVTGEGDQKISSSSGQDKLHSVALEALRHLNKDVFSEVIEVIRDEKSEFRDVKLELLIDHIVHMYNTVIQYSNSEYRVLALALYVNIQSQLTLLRSLEWLEKSSEAYLEEQNYSPKDAINKRLKELKEDEALFAKALLVTEKNTP